MIKNIKISGARQNNLKSIDIDIPLYSLSVICGPSGSGKSSLAFETLYAEGQRRYIESLPNYARQFLNKAPKPDVDAVDNIPPAVSIGQKNLLKSARHTVGTQTEIIDYLRLLFAKAGDVTCPEHGLKLTKHSPIAGAQKVLEQFKDARGYVLCPVPEANRSLSGAPLLKALKQEGFNRIYHKKKVIDLEGKKSLPKDLFYIVIDRMAFTEVEEQRLTDSIAQAFSFYNRYQKSFQPPQAQIITTDDKTLYLSEDYSCAFCDFNFPNIDAQLFSFNSPTGACEACRGFGAILKIDEAKMVPDQRLSLNEGAMRAFQSQSKKKEHNKLIRFCLDEGIDIEKPWEKLTKKDRKKIWKGCENYDGIEAFFKKLERKQHKMHARIFLARYRGPVLCVDCDGSRLNAKALTVTVNGKNIHEYTQMTLVDLKEVLSKVQLSPEKQEVCKEVMRQLTSRLQFLIDVGVGYLELDRPAKTLSGGEFQRIKLSNQLGMELSQTLYVLDEPTVGLHPRDNDRLIEILKSLRDLGNTLVVVEHDLDVIKNSSHVIELGPQSGHLGGNIIFSGKYESFLNNKESSTVPYLNTQMLSPLPQPRPCNTKDGKYNLKISGCTGHNLKNVNLTLPLNRIVTITGVSGSGKSSLVGGTLYPALAYELKVGHTPPLPYKNISGFHQLKNTLYIDQSPVGKTARSCPATYLKIFQPIRDLFAKTEAAKAAGYTPGTFSLNVDGGRCPSCRGLGFETIDMMFMDDIHLVCEACDGKKYRDEVLEIYFKNKNINDILNMTVSEAEEFFVSYIGIRKPLSLLRSVGLNYVKLGQPAHTLSGGENQRLKIIKELGSGGQQPTLYMLDEPTTGLHFKEVNLLLNVLNKLVDAGHSVVLVEHNLEVIKNSDYIIDIGPEPGAKGGTIVSEGSPEEICKSTKSHTGRYLKNYLGV